jgi:rhodanese-related sulfurtransferase
MKAFVAVLVRAFVLAVAFSSAGLVSNFASDAPLPWVYNPPNEVELGGVKVRLVNEREAVSYLDDPETVFVDSRTCADYAKSRIKGAICLPPESVEQRFPTVEPLIPLESRVILYCYGPECDMAERVAEFLAQVGYRNMMIMNSGFPAWQRAKFPVERTAEKEPTADDSSEELT